jgi:hypothetical protein
MQQFQHFRTRYISKQAGAMEIKITNTAFNSQLGNIDI